MFNNIRASYYSSELLNISSRWKNTGILTFVLQNFISFINGSAFSGTSLVTLLTFSTSISE